MKTRFEHDLQQKLSQREIAPGNNAWNRVLQQRQKKKDRKYLLPVLTAAAAMLVVLLYIFTQSADPQPNNAKQSIVETPPVPQPQDANPSTPTPASPPERAQRNLIIPAASTLTKTEITPASVIPDSAKTAVIVHQLPSLAAIDTGAVLNYDDLDALLAKAREEIAAGRGLAPRTDATTLLRDSETELERNFRHSVLDYLFKQKKIKLALDNK